MTMTELTFSLRHPYWEDEREEVTLWVPSPENDSSQGFDEPEDISDKPQRQWVGIGPWTSFDQYAWPIEPTPSNLVATLSKEVGFFKGGNATGYIDDFGEWILKNYPKANNDLIEFFTNFKEENERMNREMFGEDE